MSPPDEVNTPPARNKALLVAWQTVNAVRRPQSKRFTRGFLVVTPGITIRGLVPGDMLDEVSRAKIVITNFHAKRAAYFARLMISAPLPWYSSKWASVV